MFPMFSSFFTSSRSSTSPSPSPSPSPTPSPSPSPTPSPSAPAPLVPSPLVCSSPPSSLSPSDQRVKALLDQAKDLATTHPSAALKIVLDVVREREGEAGVFRTLDKAREDFGLKPHFHHHLVSSPSPSLSVIEQKERHDAESIHLSSYQNARIHIEEAIEHPSYSPSNADISIDQEASDYLNNSFDSIPLHRHSSQPSSSSSSTAPPPPSYHNHRSSPSLSSSRARYTPYTRRTSCSARRENSNNHMSGSRSQNRSPLRYEEREMRGEGGGGGGGGGIAVSFDINTPSLSSQLQYVASSGVLFDSGHSMNMNRIEPLDICFSSLTVTDKPLASPSTAPLLISAGKEDLLSEAFQSAENVACPRCNGLLPKTRIEKHILYWCEAKDHN